MGEFGEGELVEVRLKEDGYFGSFFEAKVLSKLPHGPFYEVEYRNLLENWPSRSENPQPLVEIIPADEIRPMPPTLPQPSTFSFREKVDAFDMDAWWYGEIYGQDGDTYYVHFPTTNQLCEYPIESLRKHLELVNGQWVPSAMSTRRR
ncbi:hypothetical protein Bca52824_013420 [Brassica carinata]|uniref:Agenet domain-containing protein n=1 Tax=Brassica carinata TaxID=52824 RepID=A0A8X7VZJ4_BRACI|nr:hypothetical protein Bca52824_013420 [Brassica carinata]